MEKVIPENKLYEVLNSVLFEKSDTSNVVSGFKSIFEQHPSDCGFNSDTFNTLFNKASENPNNIDYRIDCVTYLMKCVLKNKNVIDYFSTIYRQATESEY